MGAVYAATHQNNRSKVAIKMLHPELSINADIRARFLREGYIANTVEHPGVVRVLDDDVTEDGAVLLVLELLQGETLGTRFDRSGPLPIPDVVLAAIELCDVLAVAHAKGIVHRDIKPDNVFVTRRGTVRVLDFGIARARDDQGGRSTRTGQMLGSPAFMAPEQALGHVDEVGPATDVWAVGSTMFFLLTGKIVHEGKTTNEVVIATATKPARSVRSVAPDLPSDLADIIDKALAFEKENRWPDARALRTELRSVLQRLCPDGHRLPASPSCLPELALEEEELRERLAMLGPLKAMPASVPKLAIEEKSTPKEDAFADTVAGDQTPVPGALASVPTPSASAPGVVASAKTGGSTRAKPLVPAAFIVGAVVVLALIGLAAMVRARSGDSLAAEKSPALAPTPTAASIAPSSVTPVLPEPNLPTAVVPSSTPEPPAPSSAPKVVPPAAKATPSPKASASAPAIPRPPQPRSSSDPLDRQ
jgi:serine/threonine-protein kinase